MTDILLSKPKLPPDYIDLSVGEATLIKQALFKVVKPFSSCNAEIYNYPNPNGYEPLVKLLEEKHQAPVIITNGAKQALAASFWLLSKLGYTVLGMKNPYWALIPPLAEEYGLECNVSDSYIEPFLLLAPNNPNGDCESYSSLKLLEHDSKLPFIHDAVYFTHSYLPEDYELGPLGDLQIFSISKMFGLSGLRVGYIVCHNQQYYKDLCAYVEMMTVGVSNISQDVSYNLLQFFKENPEKQLEFEGSCREALLKARQIFSKVDGSKIELPDNFLNVPGMFAWVRLKDKEALTRAKVNAINGSLFGDAEFVRINLAVEHSVLEECISRINKG